MTKNNPQAVESLLTNKLNNGQKRTVFHTSEALSAIFMPKIEYRTTLLSNEERFSFSREIFQGGLSMLNPIEISLLNYCFEAKACNALLTAMLNHSDIDYSTVDELRDYGELSHFTDDELHTALHELCKRGFLLVVEKPYGDVYAVNKLRISNMEFVYGA